MSGNAFGDSAFGLLIGVDQFLDPQYAEQPLPHAVHDVTDVASTLERSLGWRSDHLEILTGIVTKDAVIEGFKRIGDKVRSAGTAELFLVYISTHGHPYKSVRRAYDVTLMTTDGSLANALQMFESTLTRPLLGACIDSVPARQKAVIVDACYAAGAAAAEDIVPFDSRELDAAVLASSTRRSYAEDSRRNSEFTGSLLDGIHTLIGRTVGLTDLFSLVSQNSKVLPYLDNKGHYIVLGAPTPATPRPQLTPASFQAFFTAALKTVAQRALHDPLSDAYVARTDAECQFDRLISNKSRLITVVGPPGAGKTTFLVRSANRAIAGEAGVLWIDPTDVRELSASAILERILAPLGARLTLSAAMKGAQRRGPWLIMLDGINEWAMPPAETQQLLLDFAEVAASSEALLVLSCREESWRGLVDAFGEQVHDADIVLSNFDDTEVQQVFERLGRSLPAAVVSVLRRPLFVRMLLEARQALADRPFDLGQLFGAYVQTKATAIATRLAIAPSRVVGELLACARWLLEHRAETMPVERFFETTSEALSVVLLEEGLCVRTGGEIGFESETLLEYLISLALPDDPFAEVDLGERQPADVWWGAAAFKAAQLAPARLHSVLATLAQDWWSQEYVLSLIARLTDPSLHASVVESLAGEKFMLPETLERFLRELLDRGDTPQTELVLLAVRASVVGKLGSWREKDWAQTPPGEFDEFLGKKGSEQIGLIVLRAHDVDPDTTFDTLIRYLQDDTYLADHEARVSDFAALFLRHLGWRDLDGIVLATERFAEGVDSMSNHAHEMIRVIEFIAQNRGDIPVQIVARWMGSACQMLRMAATRLVPAVPAADTRRLMAALERYARREDISEYERASAISWIGSRSSRAALNCLAALSEAEECQAGVIKAYLRLVNEYPAEVVKRVEAFNRMTALREDVIEALTAFYLSHTSTAPDAAVAFFRKLQREHRGRYAKDIAYSIHALAEPKPVVTRFVEEEILRERSGHALELYHYYLRKVRPSNDGDVPWLRQWIDSGDATYGLLSYLLNGNASYDHKADLYQRLDAVDPHYPKAYDLAAKGAEFVRQFHRDSRSESLTEDGKVWVGEIVRGSSSGEAARAVEQARSQKIMARLREREADHD